MALNIMDDAAVSEQIGSHDFVASMLPYEFHTRVAKMCVAQHKSMLTTSYAKEEIYQLDKPAREKSVLILRKLDSIPALTTFQPCKLSTMSKPKADVSSPLNPMPVDFLRQTQIPTHGIINFPGAQRRIGCRQKRRQIHAGRQSHQHGRQRYFAAYLANSN